MAADEVETRLRAIFERLFEVRPEAITDRTRRGGLERWDSLGHLELLEALRREFSIDIPPEAALAMETFADVKLIVGRLLVEAS